MKGFDRETFRGTGRRALEFGRTRRARLIVLVIMLFFVAFSVTGFFILPPYAKKFAVEKLSEQLGRQISLSSVLINPYELSFTLKGFSISEADGKSVFIACDRLYVNLEMMSVFRGGPVISEVKIEKPYIHIARTGQNSYNFSDIIEKLESSKPAAPGDKASSPLRFSVSNIQITEGRVEFDDRPVSTRHTISQINLSIPFISNLASYVESFVEPSLSATVNGTPVNFKGGSKVFSDSRETSFDIILRDIDIPYYLGYTPAQLNVKIPSGKLDIEMKFSYRQFKDRKPLLALTGETRLKDFMARLRSGGDDFMRLPAASVKDISFDMEANRIEIGEFTSERGWISAARMKDGQFNLAAIMAQSGKPAARQGPGRQRAEPEGESTKVLLKSILIKAYAVRISDSSLSEPFVLNIGDIAIKGTNISTEKDSKGSFDVFASIEKKGIMSLKGSLTLIPVVAEMTADVKGFPLKPLSPYLAEKVRAILAGGTVNVSGNVLASMPRGGDPRAAFRGKLWINRLSLLDKLNAEDLLKWETLYAGEADLRYAPLFVHIHEVSVSNFYSRIVVNSDRTVNLQEIFGAATADKKDQGTETRPVQVAAVAPQAETKDQPARLSNIKIDRITLQGGRINFTDNFIRPRFSGNLLDIGGRITGLTSEENKYGEVELKGMYENYAPLEITGKINPLREDRYIQIKASFREMDLTALNPYSGRYAGYVIEKGKLSFQLEYLIVKNKLDAKNTVFLDQLAFGDKVDSPDATKLPVKLGVALLKDRKGAINLDIPVSGEINDPQFSLGGLITKVIVNLLVKAATSPFALLGAVFGGGEQLSYAEFDYGAATLTPETGKKLDIIIKALSERPGLKLDIIGHADFDKDREGLKRYIVMRKVKAQKLKDLVRKEKTAPSLDAVTVTPEEYPEYLQKAYSEEKFAKPRNIIGMARSLPAPEMEKLMVTNMPVTDDDLRLLARDRGLAVKDYLLKSKQIEQERVFLVESQALTGERKEGVKNSRVDFRLK
jgi:hypothetical protein